MKATPGYEERQHGPRKIVPNLKNGEEGSESGEYSTGEILGFHMLFWERKI